MGSLVPIVVTETWGDPTGLSSTTGEVIFNLLENILAPGYVYAKTIRSPLVLGSIAQQLTATDFDSDGDPLTPATVQYQVVERVLGSPEQMYYVTVPAAPPGSRAVSDVSSTLGTPIITSDSANFTADDLLAYVLLEGFPVGTQIAGVLSSTSAQLSTACQLGGTDVDMLIGASVALSAIRPT